MGRRRVTLEEVVKSQVGGDAADGEFEAGVGRFLR
jgi:hypothetical protein